MRIVNKIEAKTPQMPRRKRVAAYARVSMESERLQHSLSAQVSFYSSLIQSNPAWEYVGVYADNGITGTKAEAREEFNRMIADCEAGKIDIVLTKSISRFARNTVDLLNTVRRLKELGVSVQFEKERIDSLTEDGELMLTLLASFAQEEIRSLSDNVKWGTRKRFEKGIPNGRFQIYGYRWDGDHLVIHEEEAKIVRLIYDNYMNGLSAETTEKQLAEMGVKSYKGQHFGNTSIRQILGNITYTGNLLFQKEYVVDPISKKSRINRGELPQYFVENTHEAIIPMEVYQAVQAEKARRRELGALANWSIMLNAIQQGILTSSTKERLEALEKLREELKASILQAELEHPKYSREDIIEWISRFKYGDPDNKEYPRQIIDIFLNSIYVFDDRMVFTYNYKNGTQTVTLADVSAVFGSDLESCTPPSRTARLF